MNKSVFVSMLTVTIIILCGMYFLKIFFPQEFVFVIKNERIIAIGNFIDNHKILYYLCCGITAYITYFLYLCACAGKKFLSWKENIIVIVTIIILRLVNFLDTNIATHLSISSFFILPLLFKSNLARATIIYSVHGLAQVLSLSIRNLPLYLENMNFLIIFLMTIEMYFWLLLFYIIFNYKESK